MTRDLKTARAASPLPRLAAFGIDWCIIAAYGLVLFAAVFALNGGVPDVSAPYNATTNQLVGFVSLTLPVVVYFIIGEYRGGTVGKRIMRLRIVANSGHHPKLWQVIARNIVKFLPWELAHFCVHQFTAANLESRGPGTMVIITLLAAYFLAGLYLATLFWSKGHRTAYDRISGTSVLRS